MFRGQIKVVFILMCLIKEEFVFWHVQDARYKMLRRGNGSQFVEV